MFYCGVTIRKLLPAGIIFSAAVLFWISRNAYYVGFFNDDAFFIIGARSLLQGRFVELNQPGFPPLMEYSPGYPFLLAPLVFLFPFSTLPYQIFSIFLSVMSLVLYWFFLKDQISYTAAIVCVALAAFNPLTASLSGQVLSDIPYLLFSLATIEVCRRVWTSEDRRAWFFVAFLSGLSYCIRPIGAGLGFSICLVLVFERRWRTLGYFAFCLVALAAPFAVSPTLRKLEEIRSSNSGGFSQAVFFENAFRNGAYYLNEIFIRNLFRWWMDSAFLKGTTILFSLVLLAVGLRRFGRSGWKKALLVYLLFYALVHLSFWSKQSGRYVYPIFPFLLFFIFAAIDHPSLKLPFRQYAILGVAAIILSCYGGPLIKIAQASQYPRSVLTRPPKTYEWIRSHTNASDIFVTELDGRFFIYTGRQVYRLPKIFDVQELLSWLSVRKVGYLLVDEAPFMMKTNQGNTPHDPYPYQQLLNTIRNHRTFQKVYEESQAGHALYRVVQSKVNP